MRLPGARLVKKVERSADEIAVPPSPSLGISSLLRQTLKQAGEDHVAAFAAGLAFRGVFATFLLLLFLLSLLGLFGATDLVVKLLLRISTITPPAVMEMLREPLSANSEDQEVRRAFTLGAVISILAALWGISGAFRSVMQAMNVMYKVEEGRSAWKKYAISVGLSLAVAGLMITAGVLVAFGDPIGSRIAGPMGLGSAFHWAWLILQWPLLVSMVLLAFALVYYYAPDVQQQFRFITPGSLIGLALWLLFTLGFLLFVNGVGGFSRVYGTVAGVAIHMLYLYYFAYILLLGAEINQVVEQNTPGGKRAGEKAPEERKRRLRRKIGVMFHRAGNVRKS
jgi:membrane protein